MLAVLSATLPAAQTDRPEDLCTIEGTIVNAVTGEALRGATALASKTPYWSNAAETDAAGHFIMSGIPPGDYYIAAERQDFNLTYFGGAKKYQAPQKFTLNPGRTLRDVNIKLIPYSSISGRVTDSEGEPMANVSVSPERRWSEVLGSRTNDSGEYRIDNVPPGRYVIRAFPASSKPSAASTKQEGYVSTYYPGTTDAASAAPVEILVGSNAAGINIKLAKRSLTTIRGKVIGMTGGADNPIIAAVTIENRYVVPHVNAGPKGEFELRGVPPGSYTIRAAGAQPGIGPVNASQVVNVGSEPIENLILTMDPGVELPGRIQVEDSATIDLTGTRVSLYSDPGGPSCVTGMSTPNEAGNFKLRAHHFPCYLSASLPRGFYLKSARRGDADVLENGLDASVGEGPLELLLSAKVANLRGSVTDDEGAPVAYARVNLASEDARRTGHRRITRKFTTGPDGRFDIPGFPPGNYAVLALPPTLGFNPSPYEAPDFWAFVERQGHSLTLREGESQTVDLKIQIPPE
jgi:protocatechuate 3,4-dioxygenase beta subunit